MKIKYVRKSKATNAKIFLYLLSLFFFDSH